ncbi:Anaphase-promoting complex subunit 10 [Paramyrothecium foliicola]|nr:Anaphase-promoting complex subunit 10 [Paramyrothecium foliicola]
MASQRVPLQELPVSPGGALLCNRPLTLRPVPSMDKENLQAVVQALGRRHQVIWQQYLQVLGAVNELQARYRYGQAPHTNIFLATRGVTQPRLSLTLDSDESSSEPDLSVLGMARPGSQHPIALPYDYGEEQAEHQDEVDEVDEGMYPENSEPEAIGIDDQIEEDEGDEEEEEEEAVPLIDPATAGLKEISNLGRFTVSSHKQGNGVEELRSDDLKSYWQSDGPQPHKLTIYFVKRVGIRDIRFYVDYTEDESYTPTKIVFRSGTSENNLIEFANMNLDSPVGWQQVPIAGAGGDPDGNTLVSYVLQMQILENHQNGKDTHLRGIKIYAFDADAAQGAGQETDPFGDISGPSDPAGGRSAQGAVGDNGQRLGSLARILAATRLESGEGGLSIPDFMREPELR